MAGTWQIIRQQELDVVQDGQIVPIVRVTFATTDGDTGRIDIPAADYTGQLAAQLVGARATEFERARAS